MFAFVFARNVRGVKIQSGMPRFAKGHFAVGKQVLIQYEIGTSNWIDFRTADKTALLCPTSNGFQYGG